MVKVSPGITGCDIHHFFYLAKATVHEAERVKSHSLTDMQITFVLHCLVSV